MLMISIIVCIHYICQYIGLTIILVYCLTCSRRQHTAICCSPSYLWCSNNTQLLTAIYLPATYITTSNTHKTRILLRTQVCTHSSHLSSPDVTLTLKKTWQSHDRDQRMVVHVCKRCKTHKSRVLIRPYLIRYIAIRASKSSKRKLVAFATNSRG